MANRQDKLNHILNDLLFEGEAILRYNLRKLLGKYFRSRLTISSWINTLLGEKWITENPTSVLLKKKACDGTVIKTSTIMPTNNTRYIIDHDKIQQHFENLVYIHTHPKQQSLLQYGRVNHQESKDSAYPTID